jgi:hypothetical protein
VGPAAAALAALLAAAAPSARAMSPVEGSGTSLQPATPMEGLHVRSGSWMVMTHGTAFLVYDRQGGPRGGEKLFPESMLMAEAERALSGGRLALRGMLSLDPVMGPSGYPLLLQTGETSNGREALIDRQHPHDLFMELSARYSRPLGEESSAFAYFGYPGEPALGPETFMHRYSAKENPAAPLAHHWLDSTHIAYGAATLGGRRGPVQLEGSVFTGREPDRHRWDMEDPRFDSYSGRLSVQPIDDLVLQYSFGHLRSPEQLEREVNVDRHTASVQLNLHPDWGLTQLTFAWGHNRPIGGTARGTDAFLLEGASAVSDSWTVFGRAERVDKDELFREGEPQAGQAFTVNALTAGAVCDLARWKRSVLGVGASLTVDVIPTAIRPSYGRAPTSLMAWLRLKLI